MAQSKVNQNALRSMLLRDGTLKSSELQPSAVRHVDKAASQAAAIAARRADMNMRAQVTKKSN